MLSEDSRIFRRHWEMRERKMKKGGDCIAAEDTGLLNTQTDPGTSSVWYPHTRPSEV